MAILSRSDPCFFTGGVESEMGIVIDASLKTITRVHGSYEMSNRAFINVPLTIGTKLVFIINALDINGDSYNKRGFLFGLTNKAPAETLNRDFFSDMFREVANFTMAAGDKMTIIRLSDMEFAYSIYPDREQRCAIIEEGRGADLKNFVYPVLFMIGDVTQLTIDSYIQNYELSNLEQVFLIDKMRYFTRETLTNFIPIGDPVSFVLPACIPNTGLELAENNCMVKRIRRPFDNYNNVIFLDVDFPRGSKLVIRIESISKVDYNNGIAFIFNVSTQPPRLIESMQQIQYFHTASRNTFYLDLKNTRTVEDITFIRLPEGNAIVRPTAREWQYLDFSDLNERNDVYPYINLIGSVDRISLIEYRRGDGKNVQELGLDLVPAI